MFYLLDDNQRKQQESYDCHFIKNGDYNDILCYKDGLFPKERNQWLRDIATADAVFYHERIRYSSTNNTNIYNPQFNNNR